MSQKLKVALIQHSCTENVESNLNKSLEMIDISAENGARLIVLQELHKTLYFCQSEEITNFDFAETIPGPTSDAISSLCKKKKITVVASIFEKRAVGVYHNTAIVIDKDGTIAGKYRKMHIPDDPGFYEKFHFTPGDLGFEPIQTSIGRLGVLVCWDQWFPEAARLMAMKDAEILIYPTAIGWSPKDDQDEKNRQKESWITIQRSHAIANGLPVLAVNRTGLEEKESSAIDFWGSSFVADQQGQILSMGSTNKEEIIYAEIDKQKTEITRRIWPFFRDRRVENYDGLLNKWMN
ncbi:MAG: carbon-nitrogen hydrolase [Candidatus Caenarcaniphilales bacterium]|nr:carbon-nitrogen hydrolase [Candidatus Caenarcaniphilales bacterium]